MPILEAIRQAEDQAEAIRKDAEAKVGRLMEENQIAIDLALRDLESAGEKARNAADETAAKERESLRKAIEARTESAKTDIVRQAESRRDAAADFLVKKVLNP